MNENNKTARFDNEITAIGRAEDARYRYDLGVTDEGVIDDGVRESVGEAADARGITGTWDSASLTWKSDS